MLVALNKSLFAKNQENRMSVFTFLCLLEKAWIVANETDWVFSFVCTHVTLKVFILGLGEVAELMGDSLATLTNDDPGG